MKIIITCFILHLLAFPAWPGTNDIDQKESKEIYHAEFEELLGMQVITSSRREQKVAESPSAISVITSEEIRRSPARNIPELLQYVVGMDGFTKTHTDMDVAARGLAYDETPRMLVLLDGQPVNIVVYSGMQWPTIPVSLEDIERIEVLRGPGSSVWGADALAGVIHIITKRVENRANTLSLLYGERGVHGHDLHLSKMITDRFGLALTGGFVQTEKRGDVETPRAKKVAPNYDIKDWARIYLATYRLDYDGDVVSFSSSGGFTTNTEGYNPSPGDPSIDWSEKTTINISNQFKISIGEDEAALRIGYRDLSQKNNLWTGTNYALKYEVKKSDGLDLDLQYTLNRIEDHTIILGMNYTSLRAGRDIANNPPYIFDKKEMLLAGYGQDQVWLLDERLLVTLGARYDRWNNFESVFTPRAAANFFVLDNTLTFRFAAGKSFRRPSFDESYYFVNWPGGWFKGGAITAITQNGSTISGNNLKPERLTAYEAGVRWEPNKDHSVNLEYFRNYIKDFVGYRVYFSDPATGALNLGPENLSGEIRIKGFELQAKSRFTGEISAFLNYTYQWAEIEDVIGQKQRWANAPKHKVSGGLFYQGPVDVDLRFRYVSDVAYQEVPSIKVDGYATIDIAVSKEIMDRLFIKLSATNIIGGAHYEYPMYTEMTRRVFGNLQYTF